ncbi:MAG TPA: DUF5615 family PIN-like protein [Blastocatellia bacterium]|nr:DUF5615 family PIN-like protein [Blastocatellia bacterium]
MQIHFQADYDFNQRIVEAILYHYPTVDFQTAHKAGLEGVPDEQVLETAAREGRILVSHDFSSMPMHFVNFISSHYSPGVLLIPQSLSINRAVEELVTIWGASDAEEWINTITWLPQYT